MMKRQEAHTFLDSSQSPTLRRQLLQTNEDQGIGEKHFEVGCVYEVDHLNLPTRTPVQLKSIRVVMVTEKTELNVSVRYPSIRSLCNYLSLNKMSSTDIYPFLDEVFVMGTHLAGKVLSRQISAQEFDDNNYFEGFWLIKNSPEPAALRGIFNKETTTPLMSQLKSNGMVRWGIRRQVKFINRQGDSSTSHPQSSTSFVKGSKEKLEHESDEDNKDENDDEDNEDGEEEREYTDEDDKKAVKRKPYCLRENTRKAKKVKRETQSNKKSRRNKCKKMIVGSSINRWSAERYKLAEKNLLEVMKSKGALFKSPILRPDLRLEARKRIGDTGLLDHLLKHVAGKLAPGGVERFRRRHNADGQMEYWLESADLVKVRKEAGVQDPYWTPPPGWTPGDCPSQDPLCAKELRLLKEENAKIKRDMEDIVSNFKEELKKVRREMDEQFTKKIQEEIWSLQVQSSAPWKSDFESALVQVNKQEKQLTDISDTITGMKDQMGTLSSMVELASKTTDCCAEKERNHAALERCHALALKESASTGEKTAAEEKAAKLQKLKSGFRICKPQGTFLWPNMGASNGSSPLVFEVEDLFMVHTPPSVSSSTALAPPQLPYHHHHPPTSPIRPVPERRAVTVTVKTARTNDQQIDNHGYSSTAIVASPKSKSNTSLINLNDIPDTDGAFSTAATKRHFLPSTVKRETASAWECIGSSRCSNMSAFVAECTVNAGETSQQGKRECTSSTLCLSSAAGHRMPLSAANSTRG
ncbi:protein DYAD [Daucus carota subsp. sativus]|uniref:protein DYAD n=1 Tax=Daucus carota subsp. sativus TaxID=79200 RepID=UPI0007EFF801|nr:PREDICTED: protein DYAD-like isoform X2 [Daucus carota subsp. sativus]